MPPMSPPPVPEDVIAGLAARDATIASLHAQLRDAERRAERAEARSILAESKLAEGRAELVVILRRLRAAENALAGRPSARRGWFGRLLRR